MNLALPILLAAAALSACGDTSVAADGSGGHTPWTSSTSSGSTSGETTSSVGGGGAGGALAQGGGPGNGPGNGGAGGGGAGGANEGGGGSPGSGGAGGGTSPPFGEVVAEVALQDVNPASSTYEEAVSPRDYLERVSGWYFGHST